MGPRSLFLTFLFAAAALSSGCASLEAEHPLFSTADQIGRPPLTEGIWLGVGNDECPESNAHRQRNFARGCAPLEIRRTDDGAWQARFRADLIARPSADDLESMQRIGTMRFVLVPAVEHPSDDAFSPLYVAEVRSNNPNATSVDYYALAPLGDLPATTMLLLDMGCSAILGDGPIDGIAVSYAVPATEGPAPADPGAKAQRLLLKQAAVTAGEAPTPEITSCTASTQSAVREAARRDLIATLGRTYGQRLVFVRSLDR